MHLDWDSLINGLINTDIAIMFGPSWATSRENLFMPFANNKGADQPAHPLMFAAY